MLLFNQNHFTKILFLYRPTALVSVFWSYLRSPKVVVIQHKLWNFCWEEVSDSFVLVGLNINFTTKTNFYRMKCVTLLFYDEKNVALHSSFKITTDCVSPIIESKTSYALSLRLFVLFHFYFCTESAIFKNHVRTIIIRTVGYLVSPFKAFVPYSIR